MDGWLVFTSRRTEWAQVPHFVRDQYHRWNFVKHSLNYQRSRKNRCNLRFSVNKVAQTDMLKQLDWLVELIKENGKDTPKTIVFCDTMYSIASVFNYLMGKQKEKAFHPSTSRKQIHWLIGIFHCLSRKEYKKRLLLSFKNKAWSVLPLLRWYWVWELISQMFAMLCYMALLELYWIFIRKLEELVEMACHFVFLWPIVGTLWRRRAWFFKNKWMLWGGKLQKLWSKHF